MSTEVKAYIVKSSESDPVPGTITRRALRDNDVSIDIEYCGICHSDIHLARNDWGFSNYPMVPGHEIIGRVADVGPKVVKYKKGDVVGVGCLVESCEKCRPCQNDLEQFCEEGKILTYNSKGRDGEITYGGYSQKIVVNDRFVLKVPKNLEKPGAAPLLCAGITVYSPLVKYGAGKDKKIAVIGLGGLGAAAVKIAKVMGAEVSLISRSHNKDADAKSIGVSEVISSSSAEEMKSVSNKFDLVIDTIPNKHDFTPYVSTVAVNGNYVVVGYLGAVTDLVTTQLILKNVAFAGSDIGGTKETQEMLDFCSKHDITLEHEFIKFEYISKAYERLSRGDIKYRFVLDAKSL